MSLDRIGIRHFSIILPDGEKYKNWQTLNLIFDGLMENRAERKTTLIALGGGVIGDMVGFAAATYQRGTPFYPNSDNFVESGGFIRWWEDGCQPSAWKKI